MMIYNIAVGKNMNEDVRWKQRFQNYNKVLATLNSALELAASRELSDLEKQGMIQGFEFTFELAWNVMKDYLEEQGITGIIGSKGAIRHAFSNGIIEDGQVWMDMIEGRNLAAHSYDEETAKKLVKSITDVFYNHLAALAEKMNNLV
jgi:nucleotidyltransferase substrate binding protein (TIGR01987 family)